MSDQGQLASSRKDLSLFILNPTVSNASFTFRFRTLLSNLHKHEDKAPTDTNSISSLHVCHAEQEQRAIQSPNSLSIIPIQKKAVSSHREVMSTRVSQEKQKKAVPPAQHAEARHDEGLRGPEKKRRRWKLSERKQYPPPQNARLVQMVGQMRFWGLVHQIWIN